MAAVGAAERGPVRRLYLDRSPGELRGVVVADGRPERLLIAREGEGGVRLGARYQGRVLAAWPSMGLGRIEIGEAEPAALRLTGDDRLTEGLTVEAEVVAEAAGGKPALLRLVGRYLAGPPGLLSSAPSLEADLQRHAPGQALIEGDAAREAADAAQELALAVACSLPGGLTVTVEPTRALVAVDVDLDTDAANARSVLKANLAALGHAARLLRLKGLTGLVAIDLIGFPREKASLHQAALTAFAPDGPEVVVGPLSRFGVLELVKPRGRRPVLADLLGPDGRPSARTLAQAVVRDLERQARADPGARLEAVCAPAVAEALQPLAARLGPRFSVCSAVGADPERTDIRTR